MKSFVILFLLSSSVWAKNYTYYGRWVTTNRPLEGNMTAVITPTGKQKWRGRFYGVWQGVTFDYLVDFSGPTNDLRGIATIDGAPYEWRGHINKEKLVANFTGMYLGSFELQRLAPELKGHVWHNGHWWHQLKNKTWVYWDGSRWVKFTALAQQ